MLCNKLLQNFWLQAKFMYDLKISVGQKFGSSWPRSFLFQVSYEGTIKVSASDAVLRRLGWGWRAYVQAQSHGCWLKTLGLHHMGLSVGSFWHGSCLSIEQVIREGEGEGERGRERKRQCLLLPNLGSGILLLWPCSRSHRSALVWYDDMRDTYTNAQIPEDGDHWGSSWSLVTAVN